MQDLRIADPSAGAGVPLLPLARYGRAGRLRRLEFNGRGPVELTGREWEVVDLLRQGHSTRTMAGLLGISAVTVRRHFGTGYRKLGVRTRAELLRLLAGHREQP